MSASEPAVEPGSAWLPWWGWACSGVVLAAVAVEIVAGAASATRAPDWLYVLVPPTWPSTGRIAWWLVVAAMAGGFRLAERRAGIRRHPIVIALSVLPFLVFAFGIAIDASWAAFH